MYFVINVHSVYIYQFPLVASRVQYVSVNFQVFCHLYSINPRVKRLIEKEINNLKGYNWMRAWQIFCRLNCNSVTIFFTNDLQ